MLRCPVAPADRAAGSFCDISKPGGLYCACPTMNFEAPYAKRCCCAQGLGERLSVPQDPTGGAPMEKGTLDKEKQHTCPVHVHASVHQCYRMAPSSCEQAPEFFF